MTMDEGTDKLISSDGEADIIHRFVNKGTVVFDVGANIGGWSSLLLQFQPDLVVHTFEPVPETNTILLEKLDQYIKSGSVIPNCCGIGRAVEQHSFTYYKDASSWSTFYRRERVEKECGLEGAAEISIPVVTIDSYCENRRIEHIDFLKIDTEGGELDVLMGAQRMLKWGKIDHIQFEYGGTYQNAGITLHEIFELLDSHRYGIFKILPGSIDYRPVFRDEFENFEYADYLAVNERLLPTCLGLPIKMLNLHALLLKHRVKPRGIIHIGAHEGAELKQYIEMGAERVLFVEANPDTYQRLLHTIGDRSGVITAQCAVSDHNGSIRLHFTSMDQSSSILTLKRHQEINPSIVEEKTVEVPCRTLDNLMIELNLDPNDYNVMNIDIQGAELLALKGAEETLSHIEAINSEVNYEELYEGCARIWALDAFLDKKGFDRVATVTPYHPSWGDALYVKRPLVTMSTLGLNGRFANQIFQYAFLRIYSQEHMFRYETPPWIGQQLFGCQDPHISCQLPLLREESSLISEAIIPNSNEVFRGVDFWGYFQYHTSYYAPYKEFFRSLFQPVPAVKTAMEEGYSRLSSLGKTIVGLHLRRGDYGYEYFFIAPSIWYLDWLQEIWPTLDDPVLFIASDEPEEVLADFSEFHPVTTKSLGISLDAADYFPDFYLLSKCDICAISNSSFSFAASMLNSKGYSFYRPSMALNKLIKYDPWRSEVVLRDISVDKETVLQNLHPSSRSGYFTKKNSRICLKILLVYAIRPVLGNITLPEWIKEAFRAHYLDTIEIHACGPDNEIDIPDSANFYVEVEKIVQKYSIDAIWDIDGWMMSRDFMFRRFPENVSVPKIYWAVDTHQFLEDQKEKSKYFDLVFSAQKNAVSALGAMARWLPAGASIHEVDHHVERDIDIGFVGNVFPGLHDRRDRILARVQQEFPDFACYSNVFLDDKAKLVSQMKVVINVSLNNDINFRVFESLACGALLITDRIYDNGMEDLFQEGKHLVLFDSEDDLIHKIHYYLEHDEERRKIASEGQKYVLEHLTHKNIICRALEAIIPLVDKSKNEGTIMGQARQCWCRGVLRPSIHPRYNICSNCGTFVSIDHSSQEELKQFYSFDGYWREYQEKLAGFPPIHVRAVSDFSDRIPFWYSLVQKYTSNAQSVLEIGCSHGGFLSYCRSQGIKDVVGIEVDENTCLFAKEHFNLPHVFHGLFPDVELPFKKFDLIASFDVIEHFSDPVSGITSIANLLSDNGVFIFQTPCYRGESSEWQQFKPIEHLYLYNESNIKTLFIECELEIEHILPGYFQDDMFVIGRLSKRIRNILFMRTDSIGDNILASSIIPFLKEKYHGAKITIVCQLHIAELYEATPYIDSIIGFDRMRAYNDKNYCNFIIDRIRNVKADLALNSVYSRDHLSDILTLGSGASEIIAIAGDVCNANRDFKISADSLYSRLIPSDDEFKPELERNHDFLKGLGIDAPSLQPVIWTTEEDKLFAKSFFEQNQLIPEKTIALFVVAQDAIKQYEWYADALKPLCMEYGLTVIGLGNSKNHTVTQFHLNKLTSPSINLCGAVTIRQSAEIIRNCRLAVGTDTSLAHIACAVETPNVIILGGGHFGRFLPYSPLTSIACLPLDCYGCNWKCRYDQVYCIKEIRPFVLETAIRQTLTKSNSSACIYAQSKTHYSEGLGRPNWKLSGHLIKKLNVQVCTV